MCNIRNNILRPERKPEPQNLRKDPRHYDTTFYDNRSLNKYQEPTTNVQEYRVLNCHGWPIAADQCLNVPVLEKAEQPEYQGAERKDSLYSHPVSCLTSI